MKIESLTVEERYLLIREKLYRLSLHTEFGETPAWPALTGGQICDELERILELARGLPQ